MGQCNVPKSTMYGSNKELTKKHVCAVMTLILLNL